MTNRAWHPRRWLLGLAVMAGLVGVWVLLGHLGAQRYEAHLQRLRDAGEPVGAKHLPLDDIPDEENGADALLQAGRCFEEVQNRIIEEEMWWDEDGDHDWFGVPGGRPWEPWGEADAPRIEAVLAWLEPCRGSLEEALRRPLIRLPRDRTDDSDSPWTSVQHATRIIGFAARAGDIDVQQAVDMELRLLSCWRVQTGVEPVIWWAQWRYALGLVRGALDRGLLDEVTTTESWRFALRKAEAETWPAWRRELRWKRLVGVRAFERWRMGRDPMAESREGMREMGESLNEMVEAGEDLADAEDPVGKLRDTIDAMDELVPARPWWAKWYARPIFYQQAIDALEPLDAELAALDDIDAVRKGLGAAGDPVTDRARRSARWLAHVAGLRLARIVLALRDHRVEHGSLPATLGALVDAETATDPWTGTPFVYEVDGAAAWLASPLDDAAEARCLEILFAADEDEDVHPRTELERRFLAWRLR